MDESHPTYEWVTSHIQVSHVPHTNASCISNKRALYLTKKEQNTAKHESLMQRSLRHTKKAMCLMKSNPYYMQRAIRLIKKWFWHRTARISDAKSLTSYKKSHMSDKKWPILYAKSHSSDQKVNLTLNSTYLWLTEPCFVCKEPYI